VLALHPSEWPKTTPEERTRIARFRDETLAATDGLPLDRQTLVVAATRPPVRPDARLARQGLVLGRILAVAPDGTSPGRWRLEIEVRRPLGAGATAVVRPGIAGDAWLEILDPGRAGPPDAGPVELRLETP
jgi:hypothetical protein